MEDPKDNDVEGPTVGIAEEFMSVDGRDITWQQFKDTCDELLELLRVRIEKGDLMDMRGGRVEFTWARVSDDWYEKNWN